jgi:hypothetical protein
MDRRQVDRRSTHGRAPHERRRTERRQPRGTPHALGYMTVRFARAAGGGPASIAS